MPSVDEKEKVDLGGTDCSGLLKDAEGEDNYSRDKEEENVAPAVKGEPTGGVSDDQKWSKAIERLENVRMFFSVQCKCYLRGERRQGREAN